MEDLLSTGKKTNLNWRCVMIKRLTIIIALVMILAVPNISTAFENNFRKSLCDFPFGNFGQFEVKYDQRNFHPDYFTGSYPNGGIKFELLLGFFETVEARDDSVNQIYWVRYTNKSTGSTYIVKSADKFLHLGTPSAEYSIFHGSVSKAVGDWVIVVVTHTGRYRGSFTITREMVDQLPAIAVEPIVFENPAIPGGISVVVNHTNGLQYRARTFDDEGNITDQKRWIPGEVCNDPAFPCTMRFDYPSATGERLRIETRISGQDWPLMLPDEYCSAYEMSPGGMSRSSIWLKIEPLPSPLP
jgi:hypothetical protein